MKKTHSAKPFTRILSLIFSLALIVTAMPQSNRAKAETAINYERDYIKVASYNVSRFGNGSQMGNIASVMKSIDADIIGLQEIDINTSTNPSDQLADIASRAGYPYYSFACSVESRGGYYGHGILSKYPIIGSSTEDYDSIVSDDYDGRRVYGRYVIDINGSELCFYNTHLCVSMSTDINTSEAKAELKEVTSAAAKDDYAVIVGDFNLDANLIGGCYSKSEFIALNGGENNSNPVVTYPDGSLKIDNIFVSKSLKYKDGLTVYKSNCSDHYPIYSYVQFPTQRPEGNKGDFENAESAYQMKEMLYTDSNGNAIDSFQDFKDGDSFYALVYATNANGYFYHAPGQGGGQIETSEFFLNGEQSCNIGWFIWKFEATAKHSTSGQIRFKIKTYSEVGNYSGMYLGTLSPEHGEPINSYKDYNPTEWELNPVTGSKNPLNDPTLVTIKEVRANGNYEVAPNLNLNMCFYTDAGPTGTVRDMPASHINNNPSYQFRILPLALAGNEFGKTENNFKGIFQNGESFYSPLTNIATGYSLRHGTYNGNALFCNQSSDSSFVSHHKSNDYLFNFQCYKDQPYIDGTWKIGNIGLSATDHLELSGANNSNGTSIGFTNSSAEVARTRYLISYSMSSKGGYFIIPIVPTASDDTGSVLNVAQLSESKTVNGIPSKLLNVGDFPTTIEALKNSLFQFGKYYTTKYDGNGATGNTEASLGEFCNAVTESTYESVDFSLNNFLAKYVTVSYVEDGAVKSESEKKLNFQGWTLEKDGTVLGSPTVSGGTVSKYSGNKNLAPRACEIVTVYAKWSATFTANDAVSAKDGYTFLGWSESSTATSAAYLAGEEFSSDSSVTLYAVWQADVKCEGDINGDGVLTSTDYLILKKYFLGLQELSEAQKNVGDVNQDGCIDSSDYLLIKRMLIFG